MPTKEEMAQAYIEQVKGKIAELGVQINALEKHLVECEQELSNKEEEGSEDEKNE